MSRRVWTSFGAALLLWVFFDMTKHSALFAPFAPFKNDPYDIVGSFSFQIAVAVGVLNVLRLHLMARSGSTERLPYLARGVIVVAVAIAATMGSDAVAIVRSGVRQPRAPAEAALWAAIVVLALTSAFLLVGLPSRQALSPLKPIDPEFNWPFQKRILCTVDPHRHAIRFALVVAAGMGVATTAAELLGDGPAPTLRQTILVIIVRVVIEGTAVFIGMITLGAYLGLLTLRGGGRLESSMGPST